MAAATTTSATGIALKLPAAPQQALVTRAVLKLAVRQLSALKPTSDAAHGDAEISVNGTTLFGDATVARFLARHSGAVELLGQAASKTTALEAAFAASEVDQWVDYATSAAATTGDVAAVAERLNHHLTLRTTLAGHALTLADLAVWAALRQRGGAAVAAAVGDWTAAPHLARWWLWVEAAVPEAVRKALPKLSAAAAAAAEGGAAAAGATESAHGTKSTSKLTRDLVGARGVYLTLPGAEEGKVVTRFPPEPSGYLHVGHVKAALLNYHYAKTYKGKFILRFDDTNPLKEKIEFVENIMADLGRLEVVPDEVTYTSTHFATLAGICERMLAGGQAYVDSNAADVHSREREEGTESPFRNASAEQNLALWKEMQAASAVGKKCVVRAKIDMQHKNRSLRDPAIYRVVPDTPHHRTGTKWKIYPLYDFACPLVDSIEGITHALRSSEYHEHNPLYDWVLRAANVRYVHILDFARLNFKQTLMSKRKLEWFVSRRLVDGWNDAAFPTVQGIFRRGMTLDALREFILAQGSSKSVTLQDSNKLWAINRKLIDLEVPRYVGLIDGALAASTADAVAVNGTALAPGATTGTLVPLTLSNGPAALEYRTLPRHKKTPALGTKTVAFSSQLLLDQVDAALLHVGKEFTLMDWGNAIVRDVRRATADDPASPVVAVAADLHLEGDPRSTDLKLTWLADTPDQLRGVHAVRHNPLITKEKLEEEDKLEDFVSSPLRLVSTLVLDAGARLLSRGDRLQLERRAYFIVDQAYTAGAQPPMVLIEIPDGHEKNTMSSATATTAAATATTAAPKKK